MGAFEYTAVDSAGKERRGVLEGDTARQVRQLLRGMGEGFFQVTTGAQGRDNGGGHASPRFYRQGDHGRVMAYGAQVRYHLGTPFLQAQRQLRA